MQCLGIQINYTGEEHWVTTALSDGSVFLYDSLVGNTETLPLSLKEQFSTVYKCAANDSALIVTQYPQTVASLVLHLLTMLQ